MQSQPSAPSPLVPHSNFQTETLIDLTIPSDDDRADPVLGKILCPTTDQIDSDEEYIDLE